jgi:hypothetical protein
MVGPFGGKKMPGETPQLLVESWGQFVQRVLVAASPVFE